MRKSDKLGRKKWKISELPRDYFSLDSKNLGKWENPRKKKTIENIGITCNIHAQFTIGFISTLSKILEYPSPKWIHFLGWLKTSFPSIINKEIII